MGRTLKRVPLDFQWPMKTRWKGYVNPYKSNKCDACDMSGYNPETKKLYDSFYGVVDGVHGHDDVRWDDKITQEEVDYLIKEGRLFGWTHKYDSDLGKWVPTGNVPTADDVNKAQRNRTFMNTHDSINHHALTRFRANKLGVYGKCVACEGHGETWADEEVKKKHEEWARQDPPAGDGYQLWETTSEGSPISPVFKTLDELCTWSAENATTFGVFKASKEEWKLMLGEDMVCHKMGNVILM